MFLPNRFILHGADVLIGFVVIPEKFDKSYEAISCFVTAWFRNKPQFCNTTLIYTIMREPNEICEQCQMSPPIDYGEEIMEQHMDSLLEGSGMVYRLSVP